MITVLVMAGLLVLAAAVGLVIALAENALPTRDGDDR